MIIRNSIEATRDQFPKTEKRDLLKKNLKVSIQ